MTIAGRVFSLLLLAMVWGCSLSVLSPARDTSNYYVLAPIAAPTASASPASQTANTVAIGVGPVKTPEYLDRPEMVSRSSSNQIVLSPTDRWAQSVDKDFTSVLSQDLAALLNTNRVLTFPWLRPANIQYQVRMDVERFDTDSDGTGRLIGRWEIKDATNGESLYSGQADIREPRRESEAATLSAAIGQLGQQIADAIHIVRANKPAQPRPASSTAFKTKT